MVEPVALRLANIFGQDQVFYDSWSIRPGDGIIDQMNNGLAAPEFVFFFVSANSLSSGMVKLEWQNALYAASKGRTRIIPVRVDGTTMPPVLTQTLFIDMHSIGIEAAIAQIVAVTQENVSFTPQHQGFSNLSFVQTNNSDGSINIVIQASHLMEPHPRFMFATHNNKGEMEWEYGDAGAFMTSFREGAFTDRAGNPANGLFIGAQGSPLTPGRPFRLKFKATSPSTIDIFAVFHEKGENEWVAVPQKQ